MLRNYDWIEPVYEKPKGVIVSKKEQEEEDEFYRENPDAPAAMWSAGYWAEKKVEPPRKKRKLSKPKESQPILLEKIPDSKPGPAETHGQGQGTIKNAKSNSVKPQEPIKPIVFAEETVDPPLPSTFIPDPHDRVVQCLKVLCGNYGVVVDNFISLYIGQRGITTIIKDALIQWTRNSSSCWHCPRTREQGLQSKH